MLFLDDPFESHNLQSFLHQRTLFFSACLHDLHELPYSPRGVNEHANSKCHGPLGEYTRYRIDLLPPAEKLAQICASQ